MVLFLLCCRGRRVGADAYWTAVCSAVLIFEYVYPPSLALSGPVAVVAHSLVVREVQVKHLGAILVSIASLAVSGTKWKRG